MGVSKELFCRLPQLRECVHLEIEKKRTDRTLPPHARIGSYRHDFPGLKLIPIDTAKTRRYGQRVVFITPAHQVAF